MEHGKIKEHKDTPKYFNLCRKEKQNTERRSIL